METALDADLDGNSVQYRFSARPLPSIIVEETQDAVAVLVTLTDGCIFRITFPSPDLLPTRLGRCDSILRHQSGVLSWITGVSPVQCVGVDRVLVLATAAGAVSVHVLPALAGPADELYRAAPLHRPAPVMRRIFGFLPTLLGGDRPTNTVSALCVARAGLAYFAFMLTADLVLTVSRFFVDRGALQPELVLQLNLAEVSADLAALAPDAAAGRHLLRVARDPADPQLATLAVALDIASQSRVLVFQTRLGAQFALHLLAVKHGLSVCGKRKKKEKEKKTTGGNGKERGKKKFRQSYLTWASVYLLFFHFSFSLSLFLFYRVLSRI